jgi:hypothetical protein
MVHVSTATPRGVESLSTAAGSRQQPCINNHDMMPIIEVKEDYFNY